MDDHKRLDMSAFGQIAGSKGIKMASGDSLYEKMMLPPGVVSPFGLLNNEEKDISVYIDKEIMNEERMSFHPNTNEKDNLHKDGRFAAVCRGDRLSGQRDRIITQIRKGKITESAIKSVFDCF